MSKKSLKVQKSPNRPTTINYHFTQRIILHFVPFLGNFPDTLTKKVCKDLIKKCLASPRLPIKATLLEYLLQTIAFQITTKTMEKQCLEIEQNVGESQEHAGA